MAVSQDQSPPESPGVLLFYGADDLAKTGAVEELAARLVPEADRDFNVEEMDAAQPMVDLQRVIQAAGDVGMFAACRVVVVWNAASLWPARLQNAQDQLAAAIMHLPHSCCLILVLAAEENVRRGSSPVKAPLRKAILTHGELREFKAPQGTAAIKLVTDEAKRLGTTLSRPVAAALTRRVGGNSTQLLLEVAKLAAYAGDEEISVQHVEALVPAPPDDNIFHLIDAVFEGQRARALELVADLRATGMGPQQMVTMLARELRVLVIAKYLHEHGVSPRMEQADLPPEALKDFPKEHGLYHRGREWMRKRAWERARSLTWPRLHAALDRLVTADAGSKGWEGGLPDGELSVDLWIVAMARPPRAESPGAHR